VLHHRRLYAALILGVAAFLAGGRMEQPIRLIAGCDTFFATYLFAILFVLGRSARDLQRRAASEDEGIFVVFLIVLGAIGSCCVSVIVILHQSHGQLRWPLAMALAGAPLGWFTLHVVAAFHYANLYYAGCAKRPVESCRPLIFPGEEEPVAWDFLYYAFVVGMTAQVSDVQVADEQLRRATLGHGVVSFFFNTVLIAMAVNAVVTIAT
jgi:uncharacterized membrane protein